MCGLTQAPPEDKWERETADSAGASRTWGLRDGVLRALGEAPSQAVLEVQSRLAKLYPEYDIVHMPAEHMQPSSGVAQGSADAGLDHCQRSEAEHCTAGSGCTAAICAGSDMGQERCGAGQGATARQSSASEPEADRAPSAAATGGCQQDNGGSAGQPDGAGVFCAQFVGNAPVAGDQFGYHVDADPAEAQASFRVLEMKTDIAFYLI